MKQEKTEHLISDPIEKNAPPGNADETPVYLPPKRKPLLFRVSYAVIKRLFDFTVSLVGLIVLSPIFLITMLAIFIEDPGNPFYASTRVGKNGKEFKMYKFRSMYKHADKQWETLQKEHNEMASNKMFKMKDDPRILPKTGKFIRKTSIDELPQLINILIGNMSVVGVRPPLPKEVALYNEYEMHRLDAKVGLTCYWQCSGRSEITDFAEVVALDLKYIEERSCLTDLKIIFKTAIAVLKGRGAQ